MHDLKSIAWRIPFLAEFSFIQTIFEKGFKNYGVVLHLIGITKILFFNERLFFA